MLTTCVHLSPVTLSPNYGISKKQVVHFAWSAAAPTHVLLELIIILKKRHIKEEKWNGACVEDILIYNILIYILIYKIY